jgi:hypothetical protein
MEDLTVWKKQLESSEDEIEDVSTFQKKELAGFSSFWFLRPSHLFVPYSYPFVLT